MKSKATFATVLSAVALVSGGDVARAAIPDAIADEARRAAAPVSSLSVEDVRQSFGTRFYRLRQSVRGLPVLGAGVVVTDGRGRRGDLLLDGSRRAIDSPPPALLSRSRAIREAVRAAGVVRLRARPAAEPAVALRPAERVVWRVRLASRDPFASLEVLVDARTGAILDVTDLLERATGLAAVFDPNPVAAQGSRGGLTDGGDADSAALTALRTTVTLQRLTGNCLAGQWVNATTPAGDVCTASRDWRSVTRSDDRFEALMAYFHADRAQAYVQSLGFANVSNRQVPIRANAFADDNSAYDLLTGEIFLGRGGTDDGEDAEVIDHEYGHAIQDSQVPGFGLTHEGGAIGEGFADYFAATLAAIFTSRPAFDPCVAEWNELGLGNAAAIPCMRRVDETRTATALATDSACFADIHCYGQAWSGALWAIRARLGSTVADRLVIQSHFSLLPESGFQDASRALLAADQQLHGGAHRQILIEVLSSRQLLDVEHVDDSPSDASPLGVPGAASGHLDAASDTHDVFSLRLHAGEGVIVTMTGDQTNFDLRLLRPGATSVNDASAIVAGSTGPSTSETFEHVAGSSGTYFLDVSAVSGSGAYRIETARDADGDGRPDPADNCPSRSNFGQEDRDRDGIGDVCDRFPNDRANDIDGDRIGANRDNCPRVRNRSQTDWDGDGRGDVCDRSARVRIERITLRGHRLTVVGSVRPRHLAPRTWRLRVRRLTCARGPCRHRFVMERPARRRAGRGRVRLTLRLRTGRYRFQAVLRSPRHERTRSRVFSRRVG
jgi:hypothetical protein